MKVVSSQTMRELDRATIENGVPGELLMERAGRGVFDELLKFIRLLHPRHAQHIVVLAGKGNNGGDGYVVARLLAEKTPYRTSVLSVCSRDELTGDARLNADRLPGSVEFQISTSIPAWCLDEGVVFLDSLLGTGISGAVREPYEAIIRQINDSHRPVVAVDIPSGLNADNGTIANVAVNADLTVTVGLPKIGLFSGEGSNHCGRLRFADIGISKAEIERHPSPFEAIFRHDVEPLIRRVPKKSHKGTMGRILVVGGSRLFPGAPILTGRGALRAGGGLVTVAFPKDARALIHAPDNALILHEVEDGGAGCFQPIPRENLTELASGQDIIAIGPGLGRKSETTDFVKQVLTVPKPVVMDADALFALTNHPSMLPREQPTILTPHPGEFRRLVETCGLHRLLSEDRQLQAHELARRLRCHVVLKGPASVIAGPDGDVAVNSSGSPALATGGTGDVLTGVIAGLIGGTSEIPAALKTAVFVHGLAGESAPRGMRNLVADDLMMLLGEAMCELSPFA